MNNQIEKVFRASKMASQIMALMEELVDGAVREEHSFRAVMAIVEEEDQEARQRLIHLYMVDILSESIKMVDKGLAAYEKSLNKDEN